MRPIDADALIEDIKKCLWDWETVDGITSSTVLKQTITDIENAPTIDAVPVVRCGDCKYWDSDWMLKGCGDDVHFCPVVDSRKHASGFCDDGERRGD